MKTITKEKAFEISQAIREELNRHEGTAGCDAVLLCFAGDIDGLKLAHIKIGQPPELLDTITHLVQYLGMHSYNLGVGDGMEKSLEVVKNHAREKETK